MTTTRSAWSRGFVAGLAAMLAMALVPSIPIAYVLFATAVTGVFGPRAASASGVFIGFGALWLLLVALQLWTGGQSDQLRLIVATGIGSVVIGVGIAVVAVDR